MALASTLATHFSSFSISLSITAAVFDEGCAFLPFKPLAALPLPETLFPWSQPHFKTTNTNKEV